MSIGNEMGLSLLEQLQPPSHTGESHLGTEPVHKKIPTPDLEALVDQKPISAWMVDISTPDATTKPKSVQEMVADDLALYERTLEQDLQTKTAELNQLCIRHDQLTTAVMSSLTALIVYQQTQATLNQQIQTLKNQFSESQAQTKLAQNELKTAKQRIETLVGEKLALGGQLQTLRTDLANSKDKEAKAQKNLETLQPLLTDDTRSFSQAIVEQKKIIERQRLELSEQQKTIESLKKNLQDRMKSGETAESSQVDTPRKRKQKIERKEDPSQAEIDQQQILKLKMQIKELQETVGGLESVNKTLAEERIETDKAQKRRGLKRTLKDETPCPAKKPRREGLRSDPKSKSVE